MNAEKIKKSDILLFYHLLRTGIQGLVASHAEMIILKRANHVTLFFVNSSSD